MREEALKTSSSDEGDRAIALSDLGMSLLDRHFRAGSPADLDAAIAAFEEAVDRAGRSREPDAPKTTWEPDDCPLQPHRVVADLAAVTTLYEEVLRATPADDPGRPLLLNNLGTCLRERYARTRATEDVETAIALSRRRLRTSTRFPPNDRGSSRTSGKASVTATTPRRRLPISRRRSPRSRRSRRDADRAPTRPDTSRTSAAACSLGIVGPSGRSRGGDRGPSRMGRGVRPIPLSGWTASATSRLV